jgi:GTP-binding protein
VSLPREKPAFPIKSARYVISAVYPDQYPLSDRPEVAFAGRSNVGKSTLLNKLLMRRKLARTGATPGRTQTINFFDINDAFYFVDLPGYGYAKVPLSVKAAWRPMVESYLTADRDLRMIVLLMDIRRDVRPEEVDLLAWLDQLDLPALIVATKADKVSRNKLPARLAAIRKGLNLEHPPVAFSSVTGQGREEIWHYLSHIMGLNEETEAPDEMD